MKKIVCGYYSVLHILDPKDYVIIKEDRQRISDKYVDLDGDKFNEYKGEDELEKGDVIIRGFYWIKFWERSVDMPVFFNKFKYYELYSNSEELTPELNQGIRMRNSVFDFNHIKKRIVEMFSRDIQIEIQ